MEVIKRYTGIGGGIHLPDTLVIHAMAETIQLDREIEVRGKVIEVGNYSAHEWLVLLGLSCHFLLHPDGSFTKQRSTKEMCWHAKGFNDGSIGIEVLVSGSHNYDSFVEEIKTDYVTDAQFNSLVEMSNGIIEYFGIENIVRHSDLSPDRKVDPGNGFKWDEFKNKLI